MDAQRFVQVPAKTKHVGDLAHCDSRLAQFAEPLVDRQLLFATNAQRLVKLPTGVKNICDPAHCNRCGASITEALVNWQLLLSAYAQRFVHVPTPLKHVGNFAHCDCDGAFVFEPLKDRQLLLTVDAQCLIQLPLELKNVGDLAPAERKLPLLAKFRKNLSSLLCVLAQGIKVTFLKINISHAQKKVSLLRSAGTSKPFSIGKKRFEQLNLTEELRASNTTHHQPGAWHTAAVFDGDNGAHGDVQCAAHVGLNFEQILTCCLGSSIEQVRCRFRFEGQPGSFDTSRVKRKITVVVAPHLRQYR